MCLAVREGEYPPPEPLHTPPGDRSWLAAILAYFRECYSNPYYVWVYLATTLAALAFSPVNTFGVPYARSIGVGMRRYGECLALTYVMSFTASYALGWMADRFHPLRLGIVTMAVYAAVAFWGGFTANTPLTFAAAFVAHGVVSGAFFTVQVPIFQRLLPAAKFGQFYSAANLLLGAGLVLLPPGVGRYLDVTGKVYRYTFIAGGVLGVLAFLALIVVYRKFMRLGGPARYVAPE
jgi:MFS family permease